MRTLTLVGRLSLGARIVARRCAWCDRFYRVRDRVLTALGMPTSHGMCRDCARKWVAEMDAQVGPVA